MATPQVPAQGYNPATQIDAYWQPDLTEDRYHVDADRGVQYTRTIGMTPNFNTFVIPGTLADYPFLQVGATGSLVIADGLGNVRMFMNETIHELAEGEVVADGLAVRVVIKDRRYILNRGALVGQWNTPDRGVQFDENGLVAFHTLDDPKKRKSLRELVVICLEAMGLTSLSGYNVEQLKYTSQADVDAAISDGIKVRYKEDGEWHERDPVVDDDIQSFPVVNWELEPPGREAERLLEEHGFGISLWGNYGSLGGKLVVVKIGKFHPNQSTGYIPPTYANFESTERRLTSTNLPDTTIVVGGRIVVEDYVGLVQNSSDLGIGLEPVGIDVDGQVKPLEELSYAINVDISDPEDVNTYNPYGAFGTNHDNVRDAWIADAESVQRNVAIPPPASPGDGGAPITFTIEDVRSAAHASIWKWYRLRRDDLWKLPLLPEIVQTRRVGLEVRRKEPVVSVLRYGLNPATNKMENYLVGVMEDGYTIDYEHGIVKFTKEPMYRKIGMGMPNLPQPDGGYGPAYVFLTYAYNSVTPIVDDEDPDDKTKWKAQTTLSDYYHYPIADQSSYLISADISGDDLYRYGPSATIDSTTVEVLKRPELILFAQHVPRTANVVELNRDDLDGFARRLLREHRYTSQAFVEAPEGTIPITVTNISNDGFFRQLTWEARSGDGAITTIVANREKRSGKSGTQEYRERLFQNRLLRKLIKDDTEHTGHPYSSPSHRMTGSTPSTVHSEAISKAKERPLNASVVNANLAPAGSQARAEDIEPIPAMSFVELVDDDTEEPFVPNAPRRLFRVRKPRTPLSNLAMFMVSTSEIGAGGSGHADFLGIISVRIDSAVEVGDYVSPGNAPGQDPYVGYKGTHYRCIKKYPVLGSATEAIGDIVMPTVSKAFRGVVAGITNKELGRKELLVQEMYSHPFGYGGTPIKVDGWIESPIVCGQQIISLPCDRIDGDPVGNPPFFAIPIFAVDQSQLDLPHSSCTTRVVTPCLPMIAQSPCMML